MNILKKIFRKIDNVEDAYEEGTYEYFVAIIASYLSVFILVFVVIAISLVCCSCRTVHDAEYVTKHDTLTQYIDRRDSLYLHDSIYCEVRIQGDTVVQYKFVYRDRYRDRILHDSIYIHKTDTVIVERVIEQQPSVIERTRRWVGGFFIFAATLIGGYLMLRWLLAKHSRK